MRLGWVFVMCVACSSQLDSGAPAWRRVTSVGPSARWGHSAVYDAPRNRMIVFAGQSASGELADLWSLDLTTETWTELNASGGIIFRSGGRLCSM